MPKVWCKYEEKYIASLRCDTIALVNVDRAGMLDDVISLLDGYKQCDRSTDEILLTIGIICTVPIFFNNVHYFNPNKDIN